MGNDFTLGKFSRGTARGRNTHHAVQSQIMYQNMVHDTKRGLVELELHSMTIGQKAVGF